MCPYCGTNIQVGTWSLPLVLCRLIFFMLLLLPFVPILFLLCLTLHCYLRKLPRQIHTVMIIIHVGLTAFLCCVFISFFLLVSLLHLPLRLLFLLRTVAGEECRDMSLLWHQYSGGILESSFSLSALFLSPTIPRGMGDHVRAKARASHC